MVLAKQAQDRRHGEAAPMQEAHLARPLALVDRHPAEAALPKGLQRGLVIDLGRRQRGLDIGAGDAFRPQRVGYPAPGEVAALPLNRLARAAGVGQISVADELLEQRFDFARSGSFGKQFRSQFGARVFAARKQPDRLCPKRIGRQLSARYWGSAGAPREAPGSGMPTAARIFASISAASSGCSLR